MPLVHELDAEDEGEYRGESHLEEQKPNEVEQVEVDGALDGGELVVGELGVEGHLGVGAGVDAHGEHLAGVLDDRAVEEQVLLGFKSIESRKIFQQSFCISMKCSIENKAYIANEDFQGVL